MHSGTRLLRNHILVGHDVVGFHTYEMGRFEKELNNGVIFSPLRHPRRIAKSFKDRERANVKWPYSKENLDYQWDCMISIDKLNPIYLHIDNDIRDKEVILLSEEVGEELKVDWMPRQETGAQLNNHDIDLDQCPEAPQYQIDFYFETIERMNG